ncbi:hypothetical protein Nepgr_021155 [Nepenthes gracilis]|uniref:Uncharacterized protein n=1 Tax=Nepenthes gracilis TaxID=150966 RepID=A0AAD3SY69_NEPGR|nr:hypothetical protein Nepgr_021155 [Nepenthes gracilis]
MLGPVMLLQGTVIPMMAIPFVTPHLRPRQTCISPCCYQTASSSCLQPNYRILTTWVILEKQRAFEPLTRDPSPKCHRDRNSSLLSFVPRLPSGK